MSLDVDSTSLAVPLNEDEGEEIELHALSGNRMAADADGKIVWRIANALMTAFFLMASGVQFNDPDPFLWVPLYGIAALLTLSISIWPKSNGSRMWIWIYWTHAVYGLGMLLYVIVELAVAATSPASDGSLNPLTYEEGREMAGVMITEIWLFTCKQPPTVRHPIRNSAFLLALSVCPLLLWSLCHLDAVDCPLCLDFFVDKFSF